MNTPLPELQSLLLDLLGTGRDKGHAAGSRLKEEDWRALLGMIRQHRLGPMLHWQLSRQHADLAIPERVRTELAESFRRSTLRALVLQRELLLIHRILKQAGIPHIALKGAYLAFHAYPQSGLRPLRDLDILIPKDKVLLACQVLLENGVQRIDHYMGDEAACLEFGHHLPPLRSASNQVNIEIHSRLFHRGEAIDDLPDLSDDPEFWQRAITRQIADGVLSFASPTDLLLHLIVHAVYDHQFNNGPLILSDIAYLLETHDIDWPLFWRLAANAGHTRGCWLALRMTERYWGKQPVVWESAGLLDQDFPEYVLDLASQLTLRDFEARCNVQLQHEIGGQFTFSSKVGFFLGKVFPHRAHIAQAYPVATNSWKVYFYYPKQWWRLAVKRLPDYLRSKRQVHFKTEVQLLSDLGQWLRS